MDFFKEWMMTLLAMIIAINIPLLCGLAMYLLIAYLGNIGIAIILILLFSLAITLKNRCD